AASVRQVRGPLVHPCGRLILQTRAISSVIGPRVKTLDLTRNPRETVCSGSNLKAARKRSKKSSPDRFSAPTTRTILQTTSKSIISPPAWTKRKRNNHRDNESERWVRHQLIRGQAHKTDKTSARPRINWMSDPEFPTFPIRCLCG